MFILSLFPVIFHVNINSNEHGADTGLVRCSLAPKLWQWRKTCEALCNVTTSSQQCPWLSQGILSGQKTTQLLLGPVLCMICTQSGTFQELDPVVPLMMLLLLMLSRHICMGITSEFSASPCSWWAATWNLSSAHIRVRSDTNYLQEPLATRRWSWSNLCKFRANGVDCALLLC